MNYLQYSVPFSDNSTARIGMETNKHFNDSLSHVPLPSLREFMCLHALPLNKEEVEQEINAIVASILTCCALISRSSE